MGFLSGRVTFSRYRINGSPPGIFGPEHLERLAGHAAGRSRIASADGVDVGWTAGDHVLDTRFDPAKNVVNEALHFCLRVDTQKVPADIRHAYYQIELAARTARNRGGPPSAKQKRDAKDAAIAKLEQEAKDGRYLKRKAIPLLWDAKSNELLVGTTAVTALDQLFSLFERTFGFGFESISAGRQAYRLAELRGQTRNVDDAAPSTFVPGITPKDVAWIADEDSRDFLGNEFLLWLWYMLDTEEGALRLADRSEVAVMLARTLTLECPRGQTGYETITSEGPTRLPEARRAIQAGKLPRRVGMVLVRQDQQYKLTLQAETLAVASAKIPPPEEEEERPRLEGRIDQIRHLIEMLDLLYDAFGRVRCHDDWTKELAKMQKWLSREEKKQH